MQILLFVIARLVNLQDRIMFLVFRFCIYEPLTWKLMNFDFNITLCFLLINYNGNEPNIMKICRASLHRSVIRSCKYKFVGLIFLFCFWVLI